MNALDIRHRLPGFEQKTVLVSHQGRQIIHVFRVVGFMAGLVTTEAFWIVEPDGYTRTFFTLQDAVNAWDNVSKILGTFKIK